MSAKFADLIRIIQTPDESLLEVDGKPFPWHVTEAGAALQVARNEMPAVTVTLMANRVEVVHDIGAPE